MHLASAFPLLPAYRCLTNARDDVGFFDGYDNPSACMVVFFSHAISTVYTYADAVVKKPSVVAWMGVLVASRGHCHGDIRQDY
jgi:hypothetical protein